MVATKSQAQISCKMKQVGGIESNCTLFEPWIKWFLGYSLCNPYYFRRKQGFYLQLFREKKLERKFILSLSVDIVGFSSFKKLLRRMHVIFQRRESKRAQGELLERKRERRVFTNFLHGGNEISSNKKWFSFTLRLFRFVEPFTDLYILYKHEVGVRIL